MRLSLWLIFFVLSACARAACVEVRGDRITAGDLAARAPAFSALEAGYVLGFAPDPGLTRTIPAAELRRLASRSGLAPGPVNDVCFVRQYRRLSAEELLSALRKLPELAASEIRIVDFSNAPLPPGALELAHGGLVIPAETLRPTPILWKGLVRFDATRSTPFWVRFHASVLRSQVVAAAPIRAGSVIAAGQLALVQAKVSPFEPEACRDFSCAIGKTPRRSLRESEALRPGLLAAPPDVVRGQSVTVEAQSGLATVKIEARAEATAGTGKSVVLMNRQTNKRFSAIVTGPGRAQISFSKDSEHVPSKQAGDPARAAGGVARNGGAQTAQVPGRVGNRSLPE